MTRLALALALAGFVLASPAAAGDPVRGARLYAANCVSCHGPNGEGVTSFGPNRGPQEQRALGPPLRGVGALAADFYLRTGYMPLRNPLEEPARSDPAFANAEIEDLVAYIASLGEGPPIPEPHPERGNLAEGLHLFTDHCAGCHQVVAEGGYVTGARVPPLEDATPVQIAEAVRVGPYVMPEFSEKDISTSELDSIVAYVQYAKHPDDRGGWGIGHLGPVPEGIVTWLVAAAVLVAVCVVIGKRLKGGEE